MYRRQQIYAELPVSALKAQLTLKFSDTDDEHELVLVISEKDLKNIENNPAVATSVAPTS
jgi:hypothetical protein